MSPVVVIGFTHSTLGQLLLRWTLVLALAWLAHWVVRFGHARLRLILWRSVLCFGLVLPVTLFLPLPVLNIPIRTVHSSAKEISEHFGAIPSGPPLQQPQLSAPSTVAS